MSYSKEHYEGPLRAVLKKGTPLKIEPLAKTVRDCDSIPDAYKDLGEDRETNTLKEAKGAFSVVYIEDFWEHVIGARQELRKQGSSTGLGVRVSEFRPVLIPPSIKPPTTAPALKTHMENMLNLLAITWYVDKRSPPQPDNRFSHYQQIVATARQHGAQATNVAYLMQQGVGTALDAIWGIIGVVNKVYSHQYGNAITQGEIRAIVANSRPLMLQIANSNSETGISLLKLLSKPETYDFNPDYFAILGEDKARQLDSSVPTKKRLYIRPEALVEFVLPSGEKFVDHTPQFGTAGCFAMFAKVTNERGKKRNVVGDLWEWSQEVAEELYYPQFSRLAARDDQL